MNECILYIPDSLLIIKFCLISNANLTCNSPDLSINALELCIITENQNSLYKLLFVFLVYNVTVFVKKTSNYNVLIVLS